MLSVVLPAYNEEKMIKKAATTIGGILQNEEIEYEIVFVDDGSKDGTWQEIVNAEKEDEHVNGVHFSRNFGKESAMMAGLENAGGSCVVVMDCDLQHPPETIVEMYRLWQQGYEVVEGVKRTRGKESVFHKMSAGLFYKMISKAVKIDMSHASDFKLLDRRAVEALLEMPERNAFFRALSSWIGFQTTSVEFDVQERGWRIKMVNKIVDSLCNLQYCFLFLCSNDNGRNYRYTWVPVCGYTRYTDTCEIFFRECG